MSDQGVVLPPETVAPQPPTYNAFRGPNGIRPGWRVLIFLMIVCGVLLLLAGVLRFAALFLFGEIQLGGGPQLTPVGTVSLEGTILFITVISALIMARIERRKFGVYGLPAKFAFRKDFWVGTLIGFLAISACLLGIFALHGFQLAGLAIHGATIVTAVAAWSAAFVVVGLAEEFAFRGYLQYTLTTGMGFWPSAILLSLLFGLAHASNPGESRLGLLSVVLFGLLFCLFLRRTGNLWWAVGFHAGWDWGQTFFYGVPDSGLAAYHNLFNSVFSGATWLTGGSVGPEASIFTPIVLALVAILFSRVYRERKYQASRLAP
ncbi:MAG: type II CAAX endopeptidase family protein [Candidatus Sulfotelmatobacter sp.]|jgi:membrane protease YdiL (CAAX protease family)